MLQCEKGRGSGQLQVTAWPTEGEYSRQQQVLSAARASDTPLLPLQACAAQTHVIQSLGFAHAAHCAYAGSAVQEGIALKLHKFGCLCILRLVAGATGTVYSTLKLPAMLRSIIHDSLCDTCPSLGMLQVTAMVLGGSAKQRDKIFVAAGNTVSS